MKFRWLSRHHLGLKLAEIDLLAWLHIYLRLDLFKLLKERLQLLLRNHFKNLVALRNRIVLGGVLLQSWHLHLLRFLRATER